MEFPNKTLPGIRPNAARDSVVNPKVRKAQDLWSDAPNPARVEGQEKTSSYPISIGGHGPHYLLHHSAAFPVDLSKSQFFCS